MDNFSGNKLYNAPKGVSTYMSTHISDFWEELAKKQFKSPHRQFFQHHNLFLFTKPIW